MNSTSAKEHCPATKAAAAILLLVLPCATSSGGVIATAQEFSTPLLDYATSLSWQTDLDADTQLEEVRVRSFGEQAARVDSLFVLSVSSTDSPRVLFRTSIRIHPFYVRLAIVDLDHDGLKELAIHEGGIPWGPGQLAVYEFRRTGTQWGLVNILSTRFSGGADLLDVNRDGSWEVICYSAWMSLGEEDYQDYCEWAWIYDLSDPSIGLTSGDSPSQSEFFPLIQAGITEANAEYEARYAAWKSAPSHRTAWDAYLAALRVVSRTCGMLDLDSVREWIRAHRADIQDLAIHTPSYEDSLEYWVRKTREVIGDVRSGRYIRPLSDSTPPRGA
ncbi:FG-GAP repeat domain-containing protein [Gemmatimonadota bacterium]